MPLPVPPEFSIIIRKTSLSEKGKTLNQLLDEVGYNREGAVEDSELVILGPLFGGEAMEEFSKRLMKLGFEYWDDFYDLMIVHPDWFALEAVKR